MPKIVSEFAMAAAVLVALTLLIAASGADLALAGFFYRPEAGWVWGEREPWRFLYHYGRYPCYLSATLAAMLFAAGFASARLRPYRKGAIFITLLTLLGPGLVVSAGLKQQWGRPRPAQVQNFGGEEQYRQVWEPGEHRAGTSFPSLHAATGFAMGAPFFILRKSRPRLARRWLLLGCGYGLLMGVGRMAQGGHFASDVLWSGGIVYLLGLALYYLLRLDHARAQS